MQKAMLFLVLILFSVAMPLTGALTAGGVAPEPDAKCQRIQHIGGKQIVIKIACPKVKDYSGNRGTENRSKSKTLSHGPKLKYSVRYYSECTPDMSTTLGCDAIAESTCPDGGWRTFRVIRALNGPRSGQVISVSPYCSNEPAMEVPGADDDIAKVSLEQFRELQILASSIFSQPEGFSLRNGHAHMYAESKRQNFNITLVDQEIRVRAIPVSYVWAYGDGTSRSLNFSGGPVDERGFDEATATSHVYEETGDFGVGLTTRFRGEYSTEGGPWTPIPGVANVPSEPITMSVWRTKKILVAENCSQGSSAPGCVSLFDD